jgi:alkylhydroperoxidase/carboxymuconolactone decarboxylase family protein YurZ
MESVKVKTNKQVLEEKTESLIAIGAAMAANCIPCFEQLYEKAITSGILAAEIRRASEIATRVKNGAHVVMTHSIEELIGSEKNEAFSCNPASDNSCRCQ